MAWERRGNNLYFYRKEKVGGRVKSIYIGRGEFAALIDQSGRIRRKEQQIEAATEKQTRIKDEMIDEQINAFSEINRSLVDALFLINGFHQHKRQWRKKRK